jgi:FkbM family methyltransferase
VRRARKVRKYFKRRGLRNGVMVVLRRQLARDAFRDQQMLFQKLGQPVQTILDLGAHHGAITLRYSRLFPGAIIHSFEPYPESYYYLQQRADGNDRIKPQQMAVTDRIGTVDFNISSSSQTNSLLDWQVEGRAYTSVVKVESTTLDAYCERAAIEKIDILKLDIEGSEIAALRGARNLLEEGRVKLIYLEWTMVRPRVGQATLSELMAFLSDYNFLLFNLYNEAVSSLGQLQAGDAIFLSRSVRVGLLEQLGTEYAGYLIEGGQR